MIKKVLVTGAGGLVGSAIAAIGAEYPQYEFVFSGHKQHDLTKEEDVKALFEETQPDYVIHTAARVGVVRSGDTVVVVSGSSAETHATDTLRVLRVP